MAYHFAVSRDGTAIPHDSMEARLISRSLWALERIERERGARTGNVSTANAETLRRIMLPEHVVEVRK